MNNFHVCAENIRRRDSKSERKVERTSGYWIIIERVSRDGQETVYATIQLVLPPSPLSRAASVVVSKTP